MRKVADLSAVLEGLYDQPLLGPKPDQLLIFKRPQLAVRLQSLMQPATSAAAKHANSTLLNQVVASFYQHPDLHDHVVGWAPVRSGQQQAEVHLCFKDDSAQHRQQLAATGSIQLQLHGTAGSVSLPVCTVAAKQLPDITTVRMHNVPGGINVQGLMGCLFQHFQLGPEYSVVCEYGGDASGDIAAVTPLWCRTDVCVAEVRAPVTDTKLSKLPTAFTCFGQQVSISVQPSILAKAHVYKSRTQAQAQPQQLVGAQIAGLQPSRQKRRHRQNAKAKQRKQQQQQQQQQQQPRPLSVDFCPAVSLEAASPAPARVALARPLDPVSDLGGQCGRAGLGHQPLAPMQVDPPVNVRSASTSDAATASTSLVADPSPMQMQATLPAQPSSIQQPAQPAQPEQADISMPQAAPSSTTASLPHDFPDSSAASAMLLWAEDCDVPVADARKAVLQVYKHHSKQVSQHDTGSKVSLAAPLQKLLTRAVRVVTKDSGFNRPSKAATSAPRRSSRPSKPASQFWHLPPGPKGAAQ